MKQREIQRTNTKYFVALWIPLALIAISLFVYYQVREFEFIQWDDLQYVSENPVVLKGLTWHGIFWAFSTGHAANWHPVTWISHMIDVQLFGVDAGMHHFINVLIHIVNSLLLFWALYRMTAACAQSSFVAGLFAIHPLHVESVAWISERKDVLSALFFLLTILAYLAYLRRPALPRYLMLAGAFALALMAKPMAVSLPFVLLLLDIWPLCRIKLGAGHQWEWFRLIREKMPLIVMTIASSVVTIVVQSRSGAVQEINLYPLSARFANALISYIAYIGDMLWPKNLCLFYPLPDHSLPAVWVAGSILLLIGITIAAIWTARQYHYFLVGWLWYLGTLIPVIGLIQVGNQARADRYTYIPLIGLFIVVAWGLPCLLRRWPYRKILLTAGGGIAICLSAMAAQSQTGSWSNAVTPWEHALESTGRNYYALVHAALALDSRGAVAQAADYYREALRLNPNYAFAHNALGAVLFKQRQIDQAIEAYQNALRLQPNYVRAHSNLGAALMIKGDVEGGISHFEAAVRIDPSFAQGYYNLGLALANTGRIDDAFVRFTEAVKLAPDYVDAYVERGNIFSLRGKPAEAIAEYRKALRLNPHSAGAHYYIGITLMNQMLYEDAITHFSETLRLEPGNSDARDMLSIVMKHRDAQAKQPIK